MVRKLVAALALGWLVMGAGGETYPATAPGNENTAIPATGDPREVATPVYPPICKRLQARFSSAVRASPPASDDTGRIQAALDECASSGESVVLESWGPNDAFYSAMLSVNGEGLVVEAGTFLVGSDSYASQAELISVAGRGSFIGGLGTIDGRGDIISGTPRLIQTNDADDFTAYQITLQQAAHPHLYIQGGAGATVFGIKTLTPATRANADGIDIDSIHDVSVIDSSIEAGDDGVAVKTNQGPAYNITVKNNSLYGTHGLSIGSQTSYGVTNVLFTGNHVYGLDHAGTYATDNNAINIKTDAECGGKVARVTYANTCVTQGKHLIVVNAYYGSCSGVPGTPQFKDILVNGVVSKSSQSGAYSRIEGYDTGHLAQLYIANANLDATAQSGDQNAVVYLDNSNVTPSGTAVTTSTFHASGSLPNCAF